MNVMTKVLPFTLPDLPYDHAALEPSISAKTMHFHHDKHHKKYVDTLNQLIEGTEYADLELEEIVRATFRTGDPKTKKIFNNAGQHWNHTFFWKCLTPAGGGGKPTSAIVQALERDLGGYETFKEDFVKAGEEQFGSGWAWLVAEKSGKLSIAKTPNAETPMAEGKTCLLTIDVWEHAYYLDYQNDRTKFLKTVVDNLINWDFAEENYARAK